tara:strand:+ start:2986 stop:4638 length:1653 start_codon:yes stop_codon:yes gene_type:complete
MAQHYDSIKTMRAAKIGTIMPWGGDGGTGFLDSNIPKGWIVCKGDTENAFDYPLLASMIGDTYGGDMTDASGNHYEFPYIGTAATFRLPQLSNSCLMDLEPANLQDVKYQRNQSDANTVVGSLVADYGETNPVSTTHQATADIDFTLNLAGNLYFKFTGFTLSSPDFLETVYVLNRKLGINHTPAHSHSDTINTVNPNATGASAFHTDLGIAMSGSSQTSVCSQTRGPNTCANASAQPVSWQNGAANITFYGDDQHEWTLPRCENFMEFVNETGKNYWNTVPAGATNWRGTDRGSGQGATSYNRNIFGQGNTSQINNSAPVSTHATPAHIGMFPRPMERRSRPNFFGYDGTARSADAMADDPEHVNAKFEVASVAIPAATREIILPAGTNIGKTYGTAPNTWVQHDKITPTMFVTIKDPAKKFTYWTLTGGSFVEKVEYDQASDRYTITVRDQLGTTTGTETLVFRHGSWPMSLNQGKENKDPTNSAFRAHNHGSFEIAQGIGSMTGPPSHTADNADGASLQADSLENALNISCDTSQPNCTLTFIIKAF